MKTIDFGFEPSSCFSCRYSKEESEEKIDGKVQCESSKGFCKYWNSLTPKHREAEGFEGNPMNFLKAGGLEKFEVLSVKLEMLSGLDGNSLQTFDFYGNIAGEIDLSEEEFQSLLALKINYIRRRQIDERIKAQRRS